MQTLPKKFSNRAYLKAKSMRYEDFIAWWDSQKEAEIKVTQNNLVDIGFKEQKSNNLYLFEINQDSSVFVNFDHEGLIMDSGISTYVDDVDTLFCEDVDIYVEFKTMKDIKDLIYSLTKKEL